MTKILITGINGFIGNTIKMYFLKHKNKYEIWGIDKVSKFKNTKSVNLLNTIDCKKISEELPFFDVIIHTASIAHSKIDNENILKKNLTITENVINFFSNSKSHFIFLSSVSVYGEDERIRPVTIDDSLRPSTYYGKSKLQSEIMIKNFFLSCDILRLCPVYGINNLNDIKKRVIFPKQSFFKMQIIPSPKYSLCNIDLISFTINNIVKRGPKNKNIYNVCDNKPYSQKEISNCFKNQKLILPTFLFKPFYYLTYILSFEKGYKLRCLYWKLFKSNEYVCNLQNNHLNNKEMLIKLLNVN